MAICQTSREIPPLCHNDMRDGVAILFTQFHGLYAPSVPLTEIWPVVYLILLVSEKDAKLFIMGHKCIWWLTWRKVGCMSRNYRYWYRTIFSIIFLSFHLCSRQMAVKIQQHKLGEICILFSWQNGVNHMRDQCFLLFTLFNFDTSMDK